MLQLGGTARRGAGRKLLASSGQDGIIRLWDPATGADACPLPGHKFFIWNVALARDGKFAATAGVGQHRPLVGRDHGAERRAQSPCESTSWA